MAPLIVVTGPTASGKSSLAIDLAERYGGEIICADSRTIYRGMDIGTAKPSIAERRRVPHHLLDVVEPGERFTVHDFQALARQAIVEIRTRGNIPLLVGGTGLYIDSVVLGYEFTNDNAELRQALSVKSQEELLMMIKQQQLAVPENARNMRHLVSTLVAKGRNSTARTTPEASTHVVAITTENATLQQRITARAQAMFDADVLGEARRLGDRYGWESEAMTGNIYPLLHQVVAGLMTEEQAIETFVIRDRQLVKRQITWIKRHDYVKWLQLEDARVYIENIISSHRGR